MLFASSARKYVFSRTRSNLRKIVVAIYGYNGDTARQFVDEILQDTFFFGSALLMALVSDDGHAAVNDLDMICVLPKFFNRPFCEFGATRVFKNGQREPIDGQTRPLNDVCGSDDVHSHDGITDIMMMPGETCVNMRPNHFQHLRRWFGPANMHSRRMYDPTIGQFCSMSKNMCVASPKDGEKTTDIVFLHNVSRLSDFEFAWNHVVKTPFGPSVNLMSKKTLRIANFDMLVTNTCTIHHDDALCYSQQRGQMSDKMFAYLTKYVDRNVCDLVFEFDLDNVESVANFYHVMNQTTHRRRKRLPEKNGIVSVLLLRKASKVTY